MIPSLHVASETNFDTLGLGGLADAISCTVTEERNGEYELEMEYPVNGIHFNDLAVDRIIVAPNNDKDHGQPIFLRPLHIPRCCRNPYGHAWAVRMAVFWMSLGASLSLIAMQSGSTNPEAMTITLS